uniref:ABC transporter permease subunit n=2 Tax=Vibrio ziniensis TaxID=2711221 RepID=A0A6G7CHY4_9VIBR|nr:ABC transporter permease subunit [Vibrio ziniensis]
MKNITLLSRKGSDYYLTKFALWVPLIALISFFGLPMLSILWHSLINDNTGAVGFTNYLSLAHMPGIWHATINSLILSVTTTLFTILFAFIVAYGLECTAMPGKKAISSIITLPILAPSLVLGLGLIFILGRNGIVGNILSIRMNIYGFWGLLIANILYALPQAVLIIRSSLKQSDARQYEAANVLGASQWHQFKDITLSDAKYGLLSAAFVVFTITITDFGNAIVIGGDFSVLATEIYSQVNGQMKFGMGSVVGIMLLIPAATAVWIERSAMKSRSKVGTRATLPYQPTPLRSRDISLFAVNTLIAFCVAAVIFTVVAASFIKLWPYNLSFTLSHYDIELEGGYLPLWNSIWISLMCALFGTVSLFLLSYGIRCHKGSGRNFAVLLSSLPVGVPGLVLGLAYVFSFNTAQMPWGILYGSAILVALCNYYHYHTQGYTTMMTGIRSVPAALEDATKVLGGGTWQILRDVYLPAMRLTLLSVGVFLFMRSMVSLSAIIFLVSPTMPLGSVTIMRLDEAGLTSQAAAFSTCVMGIVAIMSVLLHYLTGKRDTAK